MTKTLTIKSARDFATVPPRQRWTKGRLFQEKALESWSVLEARARRWLVQKGVQPGVSKLPRIRAPWAMRTAKGRLVRNHKLLALAYRGKGALILKVSFLVISPSLSLLACSSAPPPTCFAACSHGATRRSVRGRLESLQVLRVSIRSAAPRRKSPTPLALLPFAGRRCNRASTSSRRHVAATGRR